jgi:hypothetical protein
VRGMSLDDAAGRIAAELAYREASA